MRAGDWWKAEVDGGPKWIIAVIIMHRNDYNMMPR
jgi:hypothetical protein